MEAMEAMAASPCEKSEGQPPDYMGIAIENDK